MPKEAVVAELAAWYQQQGLTALIFDGRGIGASDGEPRLDVSVRQILAKLTRDVNICIGGSSTTYRRLA